MKPGRDLSSGSGSGSHSSGSSSDDNGKNQRSYYASNSTSTYFVACDLCSNGAYPAKPRKKLSSWPTVRCKDIYNDLLSLNKHANPTQCYNKAYAYRDTCCEDYQSSVSRQSSSSSGSHFSLPIPKLSTVLALFCIWFVAREFVKSRRRLRNGELDFDDDSSIPPEEGTEYKKMGSSEDNSKDAPQKLMKLGKRQRGRSGSTGRRRRENADDDNSNASPVLSFIQTLVSTPPHQKKNRPRDSFLPTQEWTNYDDMVLEEKGESAPQTLNKLGSKSSRRQRSRSASSRGRRSRRDDIEDDDSNASPVLSFFQMLISTPQHQPKSRRQRRGRSRGRRSRSRSGSRSRRRTRSKGRPIIPVEPDPPQIQLV